MDVIIQAKSQLDVEETRKLFTEYARSLGFELCFQNFDKELAELPGEYTPPAGRLFLAVDNARSVGCVALRKLNSGTCEMRRLYVTREHRGKGLGRKLTEAAIAEAAAIGYDSLVLHTLPAMKSAVRLYRQMGFSEIPPYETNPVEGAVFMEFRLH
jgi:ribosomal protein S18 acetylase RimI-like enzyme